MGIERFGSETIVHPEGQNAPCLSPAPIAAQVRARGCEAYEPTKQPPNPVCPYGAKYPLMSRITCVGFVTNTLIAPLVPAGTIAAFATTLPSNEFRVETSGCACPVGHVLR